MQGLREDELYVWVDFLSIPQTNDTCKLSAISSIATYAAFAKYFIVIAPKTSHADTGATCDGETYSQRGWCRLEQWAFMAVGGLSHAYVAAAASIIASVGESTGCFKLFPWGLTATGAVIRAKLCALFTAAAF